MAETVAAVAANLDARVTAFEAAWAAGSDPDPVAFLPPPTDPDYPAVVAELVRIDLEFRHDRGEPARLSRYAGRFPGLFADRDRLAGVAFEEYRLRAAAGDLPHPEEYARRYGIPTAGWPFAGPPRYPEPGESVLDFRVVKELGRGAFGRVYLAEQEGLAGRRVAVKLSTRFGRAEPETLARLQHTHIVPVYSAHQSGPFGVVVMPFLGATTLADLLADLRARGAWPLSGRELADTLAGRQSRTGPGSDGADAPPQERGVVAEALARYSFPDAVLWLGAKLADALAHAHARGILHRDVKPANVLVADDGTPMLLDFNLAADAARPDATPGGTPAYMAPEQLRALRGGTDTVDGRADVFGLGVVLYELLTGRPPFPAAKDPLPGRLGRPPRLRPFNRAVSPAAEAIVRRCLQPDPSDRYPTAEALAEDLERQLAGRPLAHTREPSLRERLRKWRRRNPRVLLLAAGVAVFVAATLAGLGAWRAKQARDERAAVAGYARFDKNLLVAAELLTFRADDPRERAVATEFVTGAFADYGPPDAADWGTRTPAALLPPEDRNRLRGQLADLLHLDARADPDFVAGLVKLDRAAEAYRLATGAVPVAVAWEKADRLDRLGRGDEARAVRAAAPIRTAEGRDFYLLGVRELGSGRNRAAVDELAKAVQYDPASLHAWLALGVARARLGNDADAVAAFNAAVALGPESPVGYYNRGLSRLKRRDYAGADADFTAAHQLNPRRTESLVGRAQARLGLMRLADAEADLTAALAVENPETRLYFLRAEARAAAGDKAGAAADRAAGLAATPADEVSWVERGKYKAEAGDPAGALADFDAALTINPRSYAALLNAAYVHDAKRNDGPAAVHALDRVLEFYPDALDPRASRAVLLARRGERVKAHADARQALALGPDTAKLYQLAGVFALTSKTHPADARQALALLADALHQNYGFEYVDSPRLDPDLEPIRGLPEFRRVVDAARATRRTVNP